LALFDVALQIGDMLLGVFEDVLEFGLGGPICLVFDHFFELVDVLLVFGQGLVGRCQVFVDLLNRLLQPILLLELLGKFFRILLVGVIFFRPFHELFGFFLDWGRFLSFGGFSLGFALFRLLGK